MSVKANSTRLPPKTTSVNRQSANRISSKALRALIEREKKMNEALVQKLKEQSESLAQILDAGGVPKDLR
jgi:hypothetical protein